MGLGLGLGLGIGQERVIELGSGPGGGLGVFGNPACSDDIAGGAPPAPPGPPEPGPPGIPAIISLSPATSSLLSWPGATTPNGSGPDNKTDQLTN